jgi:hypothetical protein
LRYSFVTLLLVPVCYIKTYRKVFAKEGEAQKEVDEMIELLWDDVLDEFKTSILNFLNEVYAFVSFFSSFLFVYFLPGFVFKV